MKLQDAAEGLSWHDFREENGAVHVAVAGVVAIVAVVAVVVVVAVAAVAVVAAAAAAVAVAVAAAADADVGADVVGDGVAGVVDDDAVGAAGGLDGADESGVLDALAAVDVGAADAVGVVLASPSLCHIPFVSCLVVFAAGLSRYLFLADLCHAQYLLLLVVIADAGSLGLTSAAHN